MQHVLTSASSQGSFSAYREKDILSEALGNKEHPGRTRGKGVYVDWGDGFADDYRTYRSRKRSKVEYDNRLEQMQGQIARLQDQLNQVLNQSQAAPVVLGASPPQHRSSVASKQNSEHDDAQLPIDDIKVMYISGMLQR